jgi:hypothetical protein
MNNTKKLLLELIKDLYNTASSKYRLKFSKYENNYYLKAKDGTFLGYFGSHYNSDSIFNRYGHYGSKYSSLSPYNKYTNTPPELYDKNNTFVGHLSANKYVENPLDPNSVIVKAAYDMNYLDRIEEFIRDY